MSAILSAKTSGNPAFDVSRRNTAHALSKSAKRLKLQLSARLRAVRVLHGLDQHEVHDRPSIVSRWEHPEQPHAPNLLHLVEAGADPLSRPYAMEAIAWAIEKLESARDANPAQLSIFELIARGES